MPRPRTTSILALAAGLALTVAPALASAVQPEGFVPREQRNGALKYWEAWAYLNSDLHKKIGDVKWDSLKGLTDWDTLPDSFKEFESEPVDSVANSIENAAAYPRCNFELQWEDGVMTMMPHLSKMRAGARLLRVAARMDLAKGKPDDAAKHLAIMLKTGRDTAQDPVLISSLVGIAIAEVALSEIEEQVASGKLTPAARQTLLDALRATATADPMNTRASIQGENDAFVPWVEKQFAGDKPGERLMELLDLENDVRKDEARAYFSNLTSDQFHKDIARIRQAYGELLKVWDTPDAKNELDAFAKRVQDGEYGILTKFFLPSISKAKESQDKFKKHLADTIALVEKPAGK